MGRIYMFNFVSLEGYFEGAGRWEIGWHRPGVDDEFQEFAIRQLNGTELLMFGRVTYEGMASYWSSPDAMKNDPVVAEKMNGLPKIVFSRTLKEANWNNTRLIAGNAAEEAAKAKNEIHGVIAILGSAKLSAGLIREGLIDEFRIMVNPVLIGKGTALFEEIGKNIRLKLEDVKTFKSGNVLLTYIR